MVRTPSGLADALRRSIPHVFGDMTNQQGGGAWKGYFVGSMFSLAPGALEAMRHPPAYWGRAHHFAERRCSNQIADRSWAADVSFPNAGSARYGEFVLFAARAHGRWRVYGNVNAVAIFAPRHPSARVGALRVTVPCGFSRYDIRGGFYRSGTRPPVIGVVVTDYRLKTDSPLRTKGVVPVPPHGNRVVLKLSQWLAIGPDRLPWLRLPLSLNEHWVSRHFAHGTRRYGFFRSHGQLYEVFFWAGREAPAHDRACLRNALRSIQGAD